MDKGQGIEEDQYGKDVEVAQLEGGRGRAAGYGEGEYYQ